MSKRYIYFIIVCCLIFSGNVLSQDSEPSLSKSIRFTEVTYYSQVFGAMLAGGHAVAWADADNDGDLDLMVGNTPSTYFFRNYFYLNKGNGTFEEEAQFRGLAGVDEGSHAVVFADIDNDGDYDLLVANSGLQNGPGQNRIFQNYGDGFYRDITLRSGLFGLHFRTRGIAVGDFDIDGDLEFIVSNSKADLKTAPTSPEAIPRYYDRNENGVYERKLNGIMHFGFTNGVTVCDINNDGWLDFFESKRAATNYKNVTHQLWLNTGHGHFRDASDNFGSTFYQDKVGVIANGTTAADLDNDGDLDVITTASGQVRVFRNDGNLNFVEITAYTGISGSAYGSAVGDLDHDGDQDIVICNLTGSYTVWENIGLLKFIARTDSGIKPPYFSDPRGIALGDYDGDGDLDVILAHKFNVLQLFRNETNNNNYIKLSLTTPEGQAGGYGAKVWVYQAGHLNEPDYLIGYREVSPNSGYLAQNDPDVHVGTGGAHKKVDILIKHLNGQTIELTNIRTGRKITLFN